MDDDIQPPALHKAKVLRLSLVNKVQPHAIMGTDLVEYVSSLSLMSCQTQKGAHCDDDPGTKGGLRGSDWLRPSYPVV